MLPISLKQLVTITPLNNKTKQKVLDALPSMSESQQFLISTQCWQAISMDMRKIDACLLKNIAFLHYSATATTTAAGTTFQPALEYLLASLCIIAPGNATGEKVKTTLVDNRGPKSARIGT